MLQTSTLLRNIKVSKSAGVCTRVCHEATSVVITFIAGDSSHTCTVQHTSGAPLCTTGGLLCTGGAPLCTGDAPLCTTGAPLCTSGAPMCTGGALGMHAVGPRACTRRMLCISLSTECGEQCRQFTPRRPHGNKTLGSHEIKRLDG